MSLSCVTPLAFPSLALSPSRTRANLLSLHLRLLVRLPRLIRDIPRKQTHKNTNQDDEDGFGEEGRFCSDGFEGARSEDEFEEIHFVSRVVESSGVIGAFFERSSL